MPSKSKKHYKTLSRSLSSDHLVTQQSPSLDSSHDTQQDIIFCLQQASSRFPFLIGESAFVGQLSNVVDTKFRGCKIWVSESSMVSSSLAPGSVVSVSLAALGSEVESSFPLREFELRSGDVRAHEAGNHFALATLFPSSKVSKNEVRLASNLSYTMRCPVSGSIVFIYPIRAQLHGNDKQEDTIVESLRIHNCGDLHLELVPNKDYMELNADVIKSNFSAGKSDEQSQNGTISSPKTPSYLLRCSTSSPTQVALSRFQGTTSNFSGNLADSLDIQEFFKDESAKKLLQACATSWLYARILICGNLVTIPILSKFCRFRVISLNKHCAKQDVMEQMTLQHEVLELKNHVKDAFLVNNETNIYLSVPRNSVTETPQKEGFPSLHVKHGHEIIVRENGLPKLGGLNKEYTVLIDIIVSSTKNTLSSVGLRPTKGILLHGPPGTGKTSLARLCAIDAGMNIFSIHGPEVIRQYYGESEQALHEVFDSACQAAPAVVFIDELDAIAPARRDGSEELSQRMVATLLNLMDGICRTDGVLVLAATNRPDSIEPALRRPGRLDREIEIGVPSPDQRLDILYTLLNGREHTLSRMEVTELSKATHGFVGADLAALCNEAALVCLRRNAKSGAVCHNFHSTISSTSYEASDYVVKGSDYLSGVDDCSSLRDLSPTISSSGCNGAVSEVADNMKKGIHISEGKGFVEGIGKLKAGFEDFEKARMKIRPSAMREVMLEVPKVKWEDVGGQREVKTQLMEAVEWPQKHQDAFKRIGTRPPTGVLMFGPPGCSKTLMARAVASEAGLNFLAVKGPELFSKWVGESEKAVRSLFEKARANAPSIIFFDEIDGLAVIRGKESDEVSVSDRVMSQLLVELDGLHQRVNVTVIAATNRPDKIDPALLRPGRFDRLLYVGPPHENDREDIFRIHLRKTQCSSDVNIKELASLTDGCTGADISAICRNAALLVIEENKDALDASKNGNALETRKTMDALEVKMHHLRTAIAQVRLTEIHSHQELSAKFQRLVHSDNGGGLEHPQSSRGSTWCQIRTFVKSLVQFFRLKVFLN